MLEVPYKRVDSITTNECVEHLLILAVFSSGNVKEYRALSALDGADEAIGAVLPDPHRAFRVE